MGGGVPSWVERDFQAYLRCGILAHGFARARCSGCGYDFVVAFSCRSRGACPSCNARRMVETAATLVDHVLPPLPVRQWVLSVPKRLRPFLHHNPAIASAVLRIFLCAIRTTLREASPGAGSGAQIGAISFLHRFGSFLNAHFHFHVCVIDGVFGEDAEGSVQFHEATHLSASDWDQLQHTVRYRVLRYFHRHGLLERHVTDDMLTWQASGGFSIDASVHVKDCLGTRVAGGQQADDENIAASTAWCQTVCSRPPGRHRWVAGSHAPPSDDRSGPTQPLGATRGGRASRIERSSDGLFSATPTGLT